MPQTNDTAFSSSLAHISWAAFSWNWDQIHNRIPKTTEILPMVKANAYGHDLHIIADYCKRKGAVGLGVANMFEALDLRMMGYEGIVVSMGRLCRDILDAAYEFQIQIVVHSLEDLSLLMSYPRKIQFHLEIETGMHRLGIDTKDVETTVRNLQKTKHQMMGVFTHLVESEKKNSAFTRNQLDQFDKAVELVRSIHREPFVSHVENSGAIANLGQHYDWVRPGLSLYGYPPKAQTKKALRPVLRWSSPILQIKRLQKGDHVSYNRSFTAKRPMIIGTIPVGYGDGFSRSYKSLYVGYQGKRCPIVGNVCMDLLMIDLTKVKNPRIDESVVLMGPGMDGEPDAATVAKFDRTIPYEVLTRISPRVLRVPAP